MSPFAKHLANDQKQFWMTPRHLHLKDLKWAAPAAAMTAAFVASDSWIEKQIPSGGAQSSKKVSNYAAYSLAGLGAGSFLFGRLRGNDHLAEAGLLSSEAALNSTAASYFFKTTFQRQRPYEGTQHGTFFRGGTSFPSEHAAVAWSVASVWAHEYPGFLSQTLAYGLASAVTITRVTGKQHFASDALIGSALGWYFGRQVYRAHHDSDLGGAAWGDVFDDAVPSEVPPNPRNMGSPYVPMDSWVYAAFDRLIAAGVVTDAYLGIRPWTRLECARLLSEATDTAAEDNSRSSESGQLVAALQREFVSELDEHGVAGNNHQLRIESVYTRVTGISGPPLNRSYDFGQTILNDFGRPFAEGVNNVTGLSGWASAGPLAVSFRGEYQHAPASPALPQEARQLISTLDFGVPVPPNSPTPAVNHFQLLDAYVAINLNSWQLSFGKQSLWWGPSQGGPMMFSDNAVPVTMLRLDRASPFKLPSILGLLGSMRTQVILGQLSGQEFVYGSTTGLIGQWGRALNPQPFIDGVKLSFKPTPNFEFGISKTTLVGGPGVPFTLHRFLQSMFSIHHTGNAAYGTNADPGDRRSEVDFSYKIPRLRNWLTLYGDAFTEDEFSPLGYPRKSVYQGGVYMPQLPWIPKLDLRIEGGATSPPDFSSCNGCFYANGRFLSGFTNQGNIMGSWLGRGAQGEQAWSTYWLSAKNKIQFNYRHRKADSQFIAGGGTVNSATAKADIWLNARAELSGSVQYETWNFPVLAPRPQSNVTTSVQLTLWPHAGR